MGKGWSPCLASCSGLSATRYLRRFWWIKAVDSASVEARYEHIFWAPYKLHYLNLVMQEIGIQIKWVKEIVCIIQAHHSFLRSVMISGYADDELIKLETLPNKSDRKDDLLG